MIKYADDTNLLVAEKCSVSLEDEFIHMQNWSKHNKLLTNMYKTKELSFHRPNPRGLLPPPTMSNIAGLSSLSFLVSL